MEVDPREKGAAAREARNPSPKPGTGTTHHANAERAGSLQQRKPAR